MHLACIDFQCFFSPWHSIFEICHGHFFDVTGIFLRIVTGIFSMSRAKMSRAQNKKIIIVEYFWTFKSGMLQVFFPKFVAFFYVTGIFSKNVTGTKKKCHGKKNTELSPRGESVKYIRKSFEYLSPYPPNFSYVHKSEYLFIPQKSVL